MSYKNSSQFGSFVPGNRSLTPSRKIKSNADIFEDHGNPWQGDVPKRTPRLSPDGQLRMSRRAHLFNLMNPLNTVPHGDQSDLSFSTEHCLPIDIRLAKEQNHLIKSMGGQSASSRVISPIAKARASITQKRASHLVKVK